MKRAGAFLVFFAVFLLEAHSLHAGIKYRFTKDAREGTVYVDNDRFRVELVGDPAYDVVISNDGGKTQQAINTERKTFFDLEKWKRSMKPESRLFSMPAMVTSPRTDRILVDVQEEPVDEPIAGVSTKKYVARVRYRLSGEIGGERLRADVNVTALLWIAPDLTLPRVPAAIGEFATGEPAVDEEIRKKLEGAKGAIMRKIVSVSRMIEGGPPYNEVIKGEVVSLESTETTPRLFEIPKGLRYEEPVLAGPGVMSRD